MPSSFLRPTALTTMLLKKSQPTSCHFLFVTNWFSKPDTKNLYEFNSKSILLRFKQLYSSDRCRNYRIFIRLNSFKASSIYLFLHRFGTRLLVMSLPNLLLWDGAYALCFDHASRVQPSQTGPSRFFSILGMDVLRTETLRSIYSC